MYEKGLNVKKKNVYVSLKLLKMYTIGAMLKYIQIADFFLI